MIAVIILLLILKMTGVLSTEKIIKVNTEKVSRRTIVETVNASGKIYPEIEVKISSDISGEVTELYVQEGDSVKKGQTLARINNHNVVSPMNGTVLLLNIKKGERVTGNSMMAGSEIMRVADLAKIEVRVDVGENDIVKINVNDSAVVYVDAYNNRKFKGIVTQIASSNTGANGMLNAPAGAEVTNYKVYIRLLSESYRDLMDSSRPRSFPFRAGMSASADIQTQVHENTFAVPINAVTTRDRNDSTAVSSQIKNDENTSSLDDELEELVFVLQKEGRVKKMIVTSGIQDNNYIEITKGLKEGDEVITGPYEVVSKSLKAGDQVKVVPKSELFDKKK